MQKRWMVLFLSLLASGVMLLGACSDGSHSQNPIDGDIVTPDGDEPIADGDIIDIEHLPCGSACRNDKGFYCDEATQTCMQAKATACLKANEAYFCSSIDAAAKCMSVASNGATVDICVKPCKTIDNCNKGYEECKAGYCQPTIPVTAATPGSLPGGPCEYGSLWPGRSCVAGDSCVGNPAMTGAMANKPCARNVDCTKGFYGTPTCAEGDCNCMFSCKEDADCVKYTIFGGPGACLNGVCAYSCATNADCVDYFDGAEFGYCDTTTHVCGFALCVTPCLLNNCCPDLGLGFDLYPQMISGQCSCGPGPFFKAPAGQTKAPYCIVPVTPVTVDGDEDHDPDVTAPVKECLYEDDYCDENALTKTPLTCQGCNKCDNTQHKCVPKAPECTDDSGCPSDKACRKVDVGEEINCGGTCRKKVCPTDIQCGECQVCMTRDGTCQDKVPNCTSNANCSADRHCDLNKCGGTCVNGAPAECEEGKPCSDACKTCSTEGKCVAKTVECTQSTDCNDAKKKCDTTICGGTCVAKTCADLTCTPCQTCNATTVACEDKPVECTLDTECTAPKVCNKALCGGTCDTASGKKFKVTRAAK